MKTIFEVQQEAVRDIKIYLERAERARDPFVIESEFITLYIYLGRATKTIYDINHRSLM
jgi:hypothetical protein